MGTEDILQWACWARVEDDPRVHCVRGLGSGKTLCGLIPRSIVVAAIPGPLTVDCEGCLAQGAYNVPVPSTGRWQSPSHNAYRSKAR